VIVIARFLASENDRFLLFLCTLLRQSSWKRPRGWYRNRAKRSQTTTLNKFFICPFKKKTKKLEFHYDPGEHSLQVSAKSIEERGCGVEWVKLG
jgi:hypothetical protein